MLQSEKQTLILLREHYEEICAHALLMRPIECCGFVGGTSQAPGNLASANVYRLRNIAADPLIHYEAAPADIFNSQRLMRSRKEQMIGIYHSHPRSPDPKPSITDIKFAYYPNATYLIIGFDKESAVVRAFNISEAGQTYTPVSLRIS